MSLGNGRDLACAPNPAVPVCVSTILSENANRNSAKIQLVFIEAFYVLAIFRMVSYLLF